MPQTPRINMLHMLTVLHTIGFVCPMSPLHVARLLAVVFHIFKVVHTIATQKDLPDHCETSSSILTNIYLNK